MLDKPILGPPPICSVQYPSFFFPFQLSFLRCPQAISSSFSLSSIVKPKNLRQTLRLRTADPNRPPEMLSSVSAYVHAPSLSQMPSGAPTELGVGADCTAPRLVPEIFSYPELPLIGTDYFKLSSKPIFDGANGIIFKATDFTKTKVVVIKTVRIQPTQTVDRYRTSVLREFENLKKCASSKQVVDVLAVAANTDSVELSLIIQYYAHGDLLDYLCNLRSKKVVVTSNLKDAIFKQIVRGVDFLHRHDIAHRDIKPENFLIDENGNIKLNDFGYSLDLSKILQQAPLNDLYCGTNSFKAPELFQIENDIAQQKEINLQRINFKGIDIWALGIVYFQIFLMSVPWPHANIVTDDKNKSVEKFCKNYPESEKQVINLVNRLSDRCYSTSLNPALSLFKKLHYDARLQILQTLHPNPEKRCSTETLLLSTWLTQVYANSKDFLKLIPK